MKTIAHAKQKEYTENTVSFLILSSEVVFMRTSFFPKDFLKETFTLALPIAFQALINSAVNLIDVVMLGKLGDADIAAF